MREPRTAVRGAEAPSAGRGAAPPTGSRGGADGAAGGEVRTLGATDVTGDAVLRRMLAAPKASKGGKEGGQRKAAATSRPEATRKKPA